jgi:hypothetical protein
MKWEFLVGMALCIVFWVWAVLEGFFVIALVSMVVVACVFVIWDRYGT